MNEILKPLALGAAMVVSGLAHADAVEALRDFAKDVRSGRAEFTQTVTAPDGKRKKTSSGSFEFQRPNQFRFVYSKPFEQLIVGDGKKVWMYDPDLQQASSRKLDQALGASPAALLAGTNIERDFELKPQPDSQGMSWVQAVPRQPDAVVQSLRIGFKGRELAAIELQDGFGQRSLIQFSALVPNASVAPERFRFVAPPGTDVIDSP
ncbi:outer membrane lipoprotein chaperone LolA [Roseateles paludis]|jgi:outer membrane lipoprotein carrier protein|uniref:outer membrane lipoprotein chaperone LolA n=1 Tax=Roseateles paludis TaxID=3145238 RepID=UPI00325FA955